MTRNWVSHKKNFFNLMWLMTISNYQNWNNWKIDRHPSKHFQRYWCVQLFGIFSFKNENARQRPDKNVKMLHSNDATKIWREILYVFVHPIQSLILKCELRYMNAYTGWHLEQKDEWFHLTISFSQCSDIFLHIYINYTVHCSNTFVDTMHWMNPHGWTAMYLATAFQK